MKNKLKLTLIIFFVCLFSNKITYSEEKKFSYNQHKNNLLKKNFY